MLKHPRHFLTSQESWEIMSAIKRAITRKAFMRILGIKETQATRYCSSPICADKQRNPLDRLKLLVQELQQCDDIGLAVIALNHVAFSIGHHVVPLERPKPDKMTLEAECLDDLPELAQLHRLITQARHPDIVRRQCERCKCEIDQTMVKYEEWYDSGSMNGKIKPFQDPN